MQADVEDSDTVFLAVYNPFGLGQLRTKDLLNNPRAAQNVRDICQWLRCAGLEVWEMYAKTTEPAIIIQVPKDEKVEKALGGHVWASFLTNPYKIGPTETSSIFFATAKTDKDVARVQMFKTVPKLPSPQEVHERHLKFKFPYPSPDRNVSVPAQMGALVLAQPIPKPKPIIPPAAVPAPVPKASEIKPDPPTPPPPEQALPSPERPLFQEDVKVEEEDPEEGEITVKDEEMEPEVSVKLEPSEEGELRSDPGHVEEHGPKQDPYDQDDLAHQSLQSPPRSDVFVKGEVAEDLGDPMAQIDQGVVRVKEEPDASEKYLPSHQSAPHVRSRHLPEIKHEDGDDDRIHRELAEAVMAYEQSHAVPRSGVKREDSAVGSRSEEDDLHRELENALRAYESAQPRVNSSPNKRVKEELEDDENDRKRVKLEIPVVAFHDHSAVESELEQNGFRVKLEPSN